MADQTEQLLRVLLSTTNGRSVALAILKEYGVETPKLLCSLDIYHLSASNRSALCAEVHSRLSLNTHFVKNFNIESASTRCDNGFIEVLVVKKQYGEIPSDARWDDEALIIEAADIGLKLVVGRQSGGYGGSVSNYYFTLSEPLGG